MIRVLVRKKPDRARYQLYFIDPLTGQERTRSAGTTDLKEARLEAARWQVEMESRGVGSQSINWEAFRRRFQDEHLIHCEKRSRVPVNAAMNHFERIIGKPRDVRMIRASTMSQYVAGLTKILPSTTSVVAYTRHIQTALNWGVKVELLDRAPKVTLPRVIRVSKGRALTDDEVDKMLAAVDKLKYRNPEGLKRLIKGLLLSGLRASEAIRLHWELAPVRLDMDSAKYPRIVFSGKGQKSRRAEAMPITPDFAAFLQETPADKRYGKVFKMNMHAVKWIATAGEKAKIVVSDSGKYASAHDLRRTFGTRWSFKVRPIILQRIMRHADIKTTLRYYIDQEADDVGAELWQSVWQTVPDKAEPSENAQETTPKIRGKK